jgi:hypothetical protein
MQQRIKNHCDYLTSLQEKQSSAGLHLFRANNISCLWKMGVLK